MVHKEGLVPVGKILQGRFPRPTTRVAWSSVPVAPSSGCRLTADSTKLCSACGVEITTFAYAWHAETRWFWHTCPCQEAQWEADAAMVAAMDAAYRQQQADTELGDTGMARVRPFRLDTFDATLLPPGVENPFAVATAWLESALRWGDAASYTDVNSPPAGLYFYSPGKGRGKTHLAAALAHEAQEQGRLTAFVEESSYLDRRLSCDAREVESVVALPGTRAWLTVIDDLGQRVQGGDWVSDTWYGVINRRWTKAGWTVFTSNRTPEELLKQRTINEATYSRLMQMVGKRILFFDGVDQRLV